jgi:hypothetical protein
MIKRLALMGKCEAETTGMALKSIDSGNSAG